MLVGMLGRGWFATGAFLSIGIDFMDFGPFDEKSGIPRGDFFFMHLLLLVRVQPTRLAQKLGKAASNF